MLALVTACIVLPRGFFGFAASAMGRGPTADANGGQVVIRVGVCGSAHTHPHSQTQTQCSHTVLCQRRVAGCVHKFERVARPAQTALRMPCGGLWLPVGALLRPLLPVEGSAERDLQRGGEGPGDPAEAEVQLCLSGGNVDQLLRQL